MFEKLWTSRSRMRSRESSGRGASSSILRIVAATAGIPFARPLATVASI